MKLALRKGGLVGTVPFSLEIQEVGTRTPGKVSGGMAGWTDISGKAPLFDLIGAPSKYDFAVDFGGGDEVRVELKKPPVPNRFGTYALILMHGGERQFLGTVARVPSPRVDGTIENVPILGEGGFIEKPWRAKVYARMGIRGWRMEGSWNARKDGSPSWEKYDSMFASTKEGVIESYGQRNAQLNSRPLQSKHGVVPWIGTAAHMAAAATGSAIRSIILNTKSG